MISVAYRGGRYKPIMDANAFSFSFFSITLSSERLSALLAGVAPYTGSSTASAAGVGFLA